MTRVAISSSISITAVAVYMAYSLIIVPGPAVQLTEIGKAWNRVAKKKVMNQRTVMTLKTLTAVLNFLVQKIRL